MTNSPITVKCGSTQCVIPPQLPIKPHALYDGVVFVVWAFGFYIVCKSIKTIIEIK